MLHTLHSFFQANELLQGSSSWLEEAEDDEEMFQAQSWEYAWKMQGRGP